jgi:peptidoglycan/xylan/chitin deacetylase (PgdA/CDA1 family)
VRTRFSVLVYHNVTDDNGKKMPRMKDSVSAKDFGRQLDLLKEKRFNVIALGQLHDLLVRRRTIPERTVVLTFDDGYRSTFSRAYPLLCDHGFPASVFLATDFIGSGKPFDWLPARCGEELVPMNWQEVGLLHRAGIEIGSHTAAHTFLPMTDEADMERELIASRGIIAKEVGVAPATLALPFSYPLRHPRWPLFAARLESALVQAGYRCCCTLQRSGVIEGRVMFLPRIAIMGDDPLWAFYAKARGFCRCTAPIQRFFQRFVKKY